MDEVIKATAVLLAVFKRAARLEVPLEKASDARPGTVEKYFTASVEVEIMVDTTVGRKSNTFDKLIHNGYKVPMVDCQATELHLATNVVDL